MTSMTKTERGFSKLNFKDSYGEECSLQMSSSAEEPKIWLGLNKPEVNIPLRNLVENNLDGEYPFDAIPYPERNISMKLPEGAWISGRMHLSQKQVKEILPHLIRFAETGEL